MAKEIERKFLVDKTKWQAVSKGMLLSQGYLSATENTTVRVRTTADKGFLTIKGKTQGFSRDEYEYIIPLQDAQEMLTMCSDKLVTKYRYTEKHNDMLWEIDVFTDKNEGLILAEIELTSEEQKFVLPDWVEQEVTGDIRYYNSFLAKTPFSTWE